MGCMMRKRGLGPVPNELWKVACDLRELSSEEIMREYAMVRDPIDIEWEKLTPSGSTRATSPIVLVGEASDLGWPPCQWPNYVTVTNQELLAGGRLFGPREAIVHREELAGYRYPQINESLSPVCEIHVLND